MENYVCIQYLHILHILNNTNIRPLPMYAFVSFWQVVLKDLFKKFFSIDVTVYICYNYKIIIQLFSCCFKWSIQPFSWQSFFFISIALRQLSKNKWFNFSISYDQNCQFWDLDDNKLFRQLWQPTDKRILRKAFYFQNIGECKPKNINTYFM